MLTIGQVATRAGVRASAIRYYESRGLLPAAARAAGKRVYDVSVLDRLAVIELAKLAGFNLDQIAAALSSVADGEPGAEWRSLAQARRRELDEEFRRLALMKHVLTRLTGCSCATLEECGRMFIRERAKRPARRRPSLTAHRRESAKRLKPRARGSK